MFEIKPKEINTVKYWIHLGILSVVVLYILQYLYGGDMFNVQNVLLSIPLLGIGDVIAHTITGID